MLVDLNSGSGFVYGVPSAMSDAGVRINALIDAALEAEHRSKPPRDYLGGSRVGEPCARRLAYEVTLTPVDDGKDFCGRLLRIFDAGHQFEDLTIRWLQAAGFDLRTGGRDGRQFGFSVADGRLRGHIDGAILAGPDVGIAWPALFEHKALKQSSWTELVKHGLRQAKPIYFAQCQLYMAYMQLEVALFTAMNKDTQELYHEVVGFDPAEAQKLSDKAVDILRTIEADELPPGIASATDFYLCRMCPYPQRCWEGQARARASRPPTCRRRRSARSRTGSCIAPPSSRCSGYSAMPAPAKPRSPGMPSTSSVSTPWSRARTASSPARAACSMPRSPARRPSS